MTSASVGLWMISALLAGCFSMCAHAAPEPKAAELPPIALQDLDLHRSWFKPTPAKDGDPICGAVAIDARRYFRSAGGWSQYAAADLAASTGLLRVARPTAEASSTASELRGLPDEPAQLVLERPSQPRLFLYFSDGSQCGDTCTGQRLMLSDLRITAGESSAQVTAQTPEADAWTLYRSVTGAWYTAGIVDQHLQLYALTSPQEWRLTCDMALAPYRLRQSLDPTARTALAAVDALYGAALSLSGEARTSCRRNFGTHTLEPALYRPWQWLDAGQRESYRVLLTNLQAKATADAKERAAFERYNTQLGASIEALQRFYAQKFGWNAQVAARVAYDALTGAISSGLSPIVAGDAHCAPDLPPSSGTVPSE